MATSEDVKPHLEALMEQLTDPQLSERRIEAIQQKITFLEGLTD